MTTVLTTQTSLEKNSRCIERNVSTAAGQNGQNKQNRTDASIADKVDRALWDDGMLRSTDYKTIEVVVKDGFVSLYGNVISATSQHKAEEAARMIPGVLGVKSFLVPDDKLIINVAGALGKIEHEYGVKFFTGVQNGIVVLNGEVKNNHLRSLAEKCAAQIPGIRGVINGVRSPDVDLRSEDRRFFQPIIGTEMFFRDGSSGSVQKVILNPDNLRAIAMVIRARYSSTGEDARFMTYDQVQSPVREVVIPTNAIRVFTQVSGFLHLTNAEASHYPDFDPSEYSTPSEDWSPPYPYCPEDLLFPPVAIESMNPAKIEPAVLEESIPWTQPAIQSGVPE